MLTSHLANVARRAPGRELVRGRSSELVAPAVVALALFGSLLMPSRARAEPTPARPPADASARHADPAEASPTITGATGLVRLVTGDVGDRHTFRIALHTEIFSASDFLVSRDENARFIGTLAASYTPWQYLEVFLNARSQSNRNERPAEPNRQDPELILALGDLGLGAKMRYPVHRAIVVGGQLGLTLLNSVGGISFKGDATSLYVGALSTLDLTAMIARRASSPVPVRFHLNVGYQLDNSDNLQAFAPSYTLESLNVEKFALGVNRPRMQLKLGIDAQLRRWARIGLMPLAELGVDVATGSADNDFARFVGAELSRDDFDGRATAWLTLGVRLNPARGLAVNLATDVGLLSPGYGYGPPVTPWNLVLGLSYAYDPKPHTKVVTEVRAAPPKLAAATGKIGGRVLDAVSAMPVEGAVVTFPGRDLTGLSTDPDGGFVSYDFSPGTIILMVRHGDYEPTRATARVERGAVTRVEIRLQPAAPRVGTLQGKVLSGRDNKGVAAAKLRFGGAESRDVETDAEGSYRVELKPGDYTVHISSADDGSTTASFSLTAGESTDRSFVLEKKEQLDPSLVKLTRRQIVIRRKIHFATGKAELRPDAEQLLDLVVKVLKSNPQLKRIRIEGHTDNQGGASYNRRLSQSRAESVRDYLVRQGVDPERLEAKGYGPDRPKLSNLTTQGRAANRRVEFHIVEQ